MNQPLRAIWLALITLCSVMVGAAGGWLRWAGGANAFDAVWSSGAAFGTSMLLLIGIFYFATHTGPKP